MTYKLTEDDYKAVASIGERSIDVYTDVYMYSFTVVEYDSVFADDDNRLYGTLKGDNLKTSIEEAIKLSDARNNTALGRQGSIYKMKRGEVMGSCPTNAPTHTLKAVFNV